jgi:hypothetical protein
MCWTVAAVVAVALAVSTATHVVASEDVDAAARLYTSISGVLEPGTNRAAARLSTVSIDPSGDATVVFAIRGADDDAHATVAGGMGDALSVLRSVYQGSDGTGIRTVTVLGTFPFKGTKGRSVRESPVLRAVLSAERAAQVDWDAVLPDELETTTDAFWLQDAFANAGGRPAFQVSERVAAPTSEFGPRFDLAEVHLNEALTALAAGELQVGRSQFKQFFDAWEDVESAVAQAYPAEYEVLDRELERAEVALLHMQPEDVDAARQALHNIGSVLADIRRAVR